ncbi:MAG: peptidoglycan-binding protein [Verrucomicrobiota bacterium]|nr:peptidoglycan-binding protein [Verrucomicrobiota bacterium]
MNKLTLLGSVAMAAMLAWPLANADAGSRGGRGAAPASAGSRGFSSNHVAGRPAFANRTAGARFNRGNGNGRWANGVGRHHGDWRDHDHDDWRHHHHGRVFVGFYPYWNPWWDYGYGYPYGYGYGYGYYPYGNDYGYSNEYRSGGSLGANVQQALARQGFYRGPIDGVIGARTRNAIRAYERANGLRVDGLIDQRLLQTMGLS